MEIERKDPVDLVAPEWREAFQKFTATGEAEDEFLQYMERDQDCQLAVDLAFAEQARAFEEIAEALRSEDWLKGPPVASLAESSSKRKRSIHQHLRYGLWSSIPVLVLLVIAWLYSGANTEHSLRSGSSDLTTINVMLSIVLAGLASVGISLGVLRMDLRRRPVLLQLVVGGGVGLLAGWLVVGQIREASGHANEATNLRAQLAQESSENAAHVAALRKELDETAALLQASDTEIRRDLRTTRAELQAEVQKASTLSTKLRETTKKFEDFSAAKSKEVAQLSIELDEKRTEIASLSAALGIKKDEIETLKSNVSALEETLAQTRQGAVLAWAAPTPYYRNMLGGSSGLWFPEETDTGGFHPVAVSGSTKQLTSTLPGGKVSISYSHPSTASSAFLEDVITPGSYWRLGSGPTFLTTETDLDFEGVILPKGSYVVVAHFLDNESQNLLFFNTEKGLVAEVPARLEKGSNVEEPSINLVKQGTGGDSLMIVSWGEYLLYASFKVIS
jgi:hypothetical protein